MKTLNKFKIAFLLLALLFGVYQIKAQCQASFTITDNGDGTVSFVSTSIGNISHYYWDLGNGNYDYTSNPTGTYLNGDYEVCLTAIDSIGGCSSTFCDSIWVTAGMDPDSCTLSASYTFVDNGNGNVSFTSNVVGGDAPYSYQWDFSDGFSAVTANPTHTYSSYGAYGVCLTVTDNLTCTSIFCDSVPVLNTIDSCNYDASFTFVDNGNGDFSFTNTSITSNDAMYYWNFGDGYTSNQENPNHSYVANGSYVVFLSIVDSLYNCFDYYSIPITVSGVVNPVSCNAAFVVSPDSLTNDSSSVLVYNTSTGSNLTYFWDFGDGNTSTQAYPNYTYATAGPFELCLTVTSDSGCTSTYCDSIGAGGIVLKTGGFTINTVAPVVTSVEENQEFLSDLTVYPNPIKDVLNLEMNLNKSTQVNVKVLDLVGNVVGLIANKEMIGFNKLYWQTEGLANGVYVLSIKTENRLTVRKLILNR